MLKQQAKLVARIVYVADLSLTSAAFFVAFFLRDYILPQVFPRFFPTGLYPIGYYLKIYPAVLIIWSLLFFTHHSYQSHRTETVSKEARTTLRIVLFGIGLLAILAFLIPIEELSRSWFALFAALSGIFLVAEKIFLRVLARYVRERGLNYRTVLIVGTGRQAREFVDQIEKHRYWGYKILGFVDDGHRLSGRWARHRVLGTLSELKGIVETAVDGQSEAVDEVVFAIDRKKLELCEPILQLCEDLGIRTRVTLNFFPNRTARMEFEDLEGIPVITFTTTPSNEIHLAAKRLVDIGISLFILTLALPIIGLAAVAIRWSSPGAVFFSQRRVGLNGRAFTLYKFRTMIADAHDRLGDVAHLNEMNGPVFKASKDPRVTLVGRFLRRFSLDELPQLWNVLKGDMSLVGPRPPIPEEVERYKRWQRRRLSMKPGLTCLWQVSGRNEVDFDRWMELDLQYIDNWSPLLDAKILLRTIPAVLSGRGAS